MNYGKRKLASRAESIACAESPPGDAGETQDKRKVRNMTEKKRRDQFSQLISELANIVCSGTKKPDKTNVLQMTIEFLKRQKASQSAMDAESSTEDGWKPPFMSDDELLALLMEAGGSFVVVFSKEGTILFISGGASSVLGLPVNLLLGKHLGELFHPADQGFIADLLQSPDDNRLSVSSGDLLPPPARVHIVSVKGCDMDSQMVTYERAELLAMDVVPRGIIPRPMPASDMELSEDGSSEAADDYSIFIQLVGHRRSKEFFGMPTLHFGTRHSSTFKITHVDESASNVIGFQPSEMLGTPGYLYYHEDDLERIAAEHKTLIKAGCCTTAYYRHLTKSNDWVWIRSHYYVTYEMWTGKALVVHGTHYLARPEDVRNNTPYNDLVQLGNAMKSGLSALSNPTSSPGATPRTKLLSEDDDSLPATAFCSVSPAPSMTLLPGGSRQSSGASTTGAATSSAVAPAAAQSGTMPSNALPSSSSSAAAVAAAVTGRLAMSGRKSNLGYNPADAPAANFVHSNKAGRGVTDETTGPGRLPLYAYTRIEKAFMKQSIELMKNQRQISEVGDDVEAIMEAASAKVPGLLPSSQAQSACPSSLPSSLAPSTVPSPQSVVTLSTTASAGGSPASSSSPAAGQTVGMHGRRVQLSAVQQRLHEQLLKKYHELQALMELQQQELREVYQHLLLAAPLCATSAASGGDEMSPSANKPSPS